MEFRARLGTARRRDHRRGLRRRQRKPPSPRAGREGDCTSSRSSDAVGSWACRKDGVGDGGWLDGSSSSSTRSWPRCSRQGCRSSRRSTSCVSASRTRRSRRVLDDVYEKVKAGTSLSDAFAEHGELFPAVYAASLMAGERSGNLDSVIRRYVAYEKVIGTVRTPDDFGADLSGHPRHDDARPGRDHRAPRRAGVLGLLCAASSMPLPRDHASPDRRVEPDRVEHLVDPGGRSPLVVVGRSAVSSSSRASASASMGAAAPALDRRHRCGNSRRRSSRGRLPRCLSGGIPLVNALEISVRSMSNRFLGRELDIVRRHVQEGHSFAGALRERAMLPGRRGQDGGGRRIDRRAAGNAEQHRRLLR